MGEIGRDESVLTGKFLIIKKGRVRVRELEFMPSNTHSLLLVCQPFKVATEAMSSDTYPTLAHVVPVYNFIWNHVEDFIDNKGNRPELRSAAQKALDKLRDYYSRTDDSSAYTIATGKYNCPQIHC